MGAEMGVHHDKSFPGEGLKYRKARDELLAAEKALRRQVADVAQMRKNLPAGGPIPSDYEFDEGGANIADTETAKQTRFSELFDDGKDSLIIYSFMYGPAADNACPMCTSLLDSLNGAAPHVTDRVNLAVVARSPISRIRDWGRARGWNNLRLLSSANNTYNIDYFAEGPEGDQWPDINVFVRRDDVIYHHYNAELFFAETEEGQHPRHADMIWPLWNLFDLTPDGRGDGWFPKLDYG